MELVNLHENNMFREGKRKFYCMFGFCLFNHVLIAVKSLIKAELSVLREEMKGMVTHAELKEELKSLSDRVEKVELHLSKTSDQLDFLVSHMSAQK